MLLDIRTLWVVVTCTSGLLACVQWALWRQDRREKAMLFWALAHLSGIVGGLLISLRGIAPDWASVGLGNLAVSLSYLLPTAGLRSFARQAIDWRWLLLPPIAIGVAFTGLPYLAGNPGPRLVVIALLIAAACGVNLRDAWRAERTEPLRMRRLAMLAIAATLVYSVARAGISGWSEHGSDYMATSQPQAWLMLLSLMLQLLCSLCVMLMPGERLQKQLRQAAQVDALTELLNRGGFGTLAARQLERCRHAAQPVCVLLMDLDHFKRVNDTHGHEVGDRLLCAFAETLRGQCRPTDLLGRYGGEEFTALLPKADLSTALAVAERIRAQFAAATVPSSAGVVGTTVSIGVTEVAVGETIQQALQRADAALYAAKHQGRNRVVATPPHG